MKEYLINSRPRISLILILSLFVASLLTSIFNRIGNFILLYPSNLYEPLNWYRLLTYPFHVNGLFIWFKNALVIVLTGYIIENRINKQYILGLIFLSSIIGGLFFMIFNQKNNLNIPIATPAMISWGYWSATIIIGIKFRKTLNIFEKIILLLCLLSIFSIWNENQGYLIGQLMVIVVILIITLIKIKK